ncbi:hypothetical protein MMC14_003967 [Varicellaria rhodocarpa]|nr:hypothetical protein [Varicellaria rhodocarpa]
MTVEYCASLATGKYDYFGVEYSSECYMGNTLSTGSNQSVTTDCSMSCAGNKTELCGGSQRLNLYQATASIVPTTPSVVQGNANYTYYNCVVEPSGGRALPTQILASNTMTVEYCLSLASSYKYVGLEYGRECWASNSLNAAATNATASTQCGKICSGNSTEICGDSSRLTTYLRTAH